MKVRSLTAGVICLASMAPAWGQEVDGAYLGVHLGGGFPKVEMLESRASIPEDPVRAEKYDGEALIYGVLAGWGRQISERWYLGAEVAGSFGEDEFSLSLTDEEVNGEVNWRGGLSARVGFLLAPGRLLYGRAGYEMLRLKADISNSEALSETLSGWIVGAGYEHSLNNRLAIRLELSQSDYGNASHVFKHDTDERLRVSATESRLTAGIIAHF